jgi:hypothetical protein
MGAAVRSYIVALSLLQIASCLSCTVLLLGIALIFGVHASELDDALPPM